MKNKILILLITLITCFSGLSVKASLVGNTTKATLTISPQSGKFNAGDTFKINIYVNTNGQNVNVVTVHLNYNKNYFQALNIDISESLFNMIAETKIDQNSGKIRVTAGTPTPGVNNSSGLVASITFKALANTTPISDNITFDYTAGDETKSSVFLDDKKGTNILTGVYGAKFQIGEGGPISYMDGTLLKVTGGIKIYVIDGSQKRWIPTAEIFNSNGYKWSDIIEIAQSELDSITTGSNITAVVSIPEGALIRAAGDIDVWIVKYVGAKKFKRLILSPSVFNSYEHLKWSNVKIVDVSVLNSFVTSELAQAVNDTKVYKLYPSGDTGEKRWITTADAFNSMGFDWDSIYQINQKDRDSYIEGQTIE